MDLWIWQNLSMENFKNEKSIPIHDTIVSVNQKCVSLRLCGIICFGCENHHNYVFFIKGCIVELTCIRVKYNLPLTSIYVELFWKVHNSCPLSRLRGTMQTSNSHK